MSSVKCSQRHRLSIDRGDLVLSKYLAREDGNRDFDREEIAEICRKRNIAEPCWVLKASEDEYRQLQALALAPEKVFLKTVQGKAPLKQQFG